MYELLRFLYGARASVININRNPNINAKKRGNNDENFAGASSSEDNKNRRGKIPREYL